MKCYHPIRKSAVPYLFLTVLTLFACWFFVGRHGMFASTSDWFCQHSVFPDYFRRQFYQTGDFFPEFAPGIGGGQNIYHFSYYGLYNPVLLLSYLLPFVKMSDYLIAASIISLLASVLLFYYWLKSHDFSTEICLAASVLFLLAGPMIYHSCHQIMFVNYMPFLCLALIGTDRYWKHGTRGLYTLGIFLMILTSFYFAIGGILAVLLYGLSRYQKQILKRTLLGLFVPVAAAALASGILLAPTGFALLARSGGSHAFDLSRLLVPDISVTHFAYSGYGVGLTAGILMVLFVGLTYPHLGERLLSAGCLILFLVPAFSWLLNGGLYIRDKSLIPFLPVLCYLAALFCQKQQQKEISKNAERIGICFTLLFCCISFLTREPKSNVTLFFLVCEAGATLIFFLIIGECSIECLPINANWKNRIPGTRRRPYHHFGPSVHYISQSGIKCNAALLLVPSLICLTFFGMYINGKNDTVMKKQFYDSVTDSAWEMEIADILAREPGLYRLEQGGTLEEKKANLNRIWDMKQWSASVYSSADQKIYKRFREETFQIEQPFRNSLIQSSSDNPLFTKLMGVKYLTERSADSEGFTVTTQEHAAPVIYATDQVIPENVYLELPFPWRQTALMQYAAVEHYTDTAPDADTTRNAEQVKQMLPAVQEFEISGLDTSLPPRDTSLPFGNNKETPSGDTSLPFGNNKEIIKEDSGYRIQAKRDVNAVLSLPEYTNKPEGEQLLFLQFDVENHHRTRDVAIDIAGVRNKLTAQSHIYYNGNTTFTYAVKLTGHTANAAISFGAGDYSISNIKCFLCSAAILEDDTLYQSELQPDWKKTKGSCISGSIHVKQDGYLITSIPYETNFEILIDGIPAAIQKVNTAFLGTTIEKGEHQICIRYHSRGILAGKCCSCIGLLLWCILLAADKQKLRVL